MASIFVFFWLSFDLLGNCCGQYFENKLLWLIVKLLIRFATADGLVIFQSMSCLIGEHIIVFSLIELIKFACGSILTLCWLGWHDGQINPWLSGLTLFNPWSIGDCVDIVIIAVSLIELRFFPGFHINLMAGLTPDYLDWLGLTLWALGNIWTLMFSVVIVWSLMIVLSHNFFK